MKYRLDLLAVCLLFMSPVHAQVFDHALAFGFDNTAFDVHALDNDRWLITGVGRTPPIDAAFDTAVAIIFNSDGEILLRKRLDLTGPELLYINSVVGTPGGGFVMSIKTNSCSSGGDDVSIYAFDSFGNLLWVNQSSGVFSLQPYLLKITPDGNLLGVQRDQFIKFDLLTGDTIWIAPMVFDGFDLFIRDLVFHQNNEDSILAVGFNELQYWVRDGTTNPARFFGKRNYISNESGFEKVVPSLTGEYFTYSIHNGRLYKFQWGSTDVSTIAGYPFIISDLLRTDSNLLLLAQADTTSMLLGATFNGHISDTLALFDRWRTAENFDLKNGQLAIAGATGAGPAFQPYPWLNYNSNQIWFQTKSLNSTLPPPKFPNAALTGIQQDEPLTVFSQLNPELQELDYTFSGGQFQVQITNSGTVPIQNVEVLTGFENSYSLSCHYRPAERRRFENLNLAPGTSVWLSFGNIMAGHQPEPPTQFCFWTAVPNQKPDANHDDDVYCLDILVDVVEPAPSPVKIFPNPASSGFWVEAPEDTLPYCNLFDSQGRLMQVIEIPAAASQVFIPTADLPKGMYFFQLGAFVEKIIVRHEE